MSFYFDDFDDDGGGTQGTPLPSQSQGGEQEFMCANCGGQEAYEDGGILCCANCFTQSQEMVYEKESTLHFDDIMAVAARTKGGQIKTTSKKRKRGEASKRKPKQPLEELDTSQPLPDLKLCIHGFTATLQGGIKSVSSIMRLDSSEQQALRESVKSIWLTYLRAWRDGAEHYGAIYPEMRFSLRDSFLSGTHVNALIRVLSYKAEAKVKNELKSSESDDNNDGDPLRSPLYREKDSKEKTDETSDSLDVIAEVHSTGNLQYPAHGSQKKKRQFYSIDEILKSSNASSILQRKTAALALRPGMDFATAIIWFVIARIGITPGQICSWIANGSLPFLNAFERILSKEDQERLKFVHKSFKMLSPPAPARVETLAAYLAIACDMKASKDIPQHRVYMESINASEDSGPSDRKQRVLDRIRFVPVDCVPLMVGQLVADLRLGQKVLNIALSLIGKTPTSVTEWLPKPLERTHPARISTPEYALGLLAVACKMCPDWEAWSYVKITPKNKREDKKPRIAANERFVPWNEEQFSLLDEKNIPDYLDFIEEIVLVKDNEDTHPSYKKIASIFETSCEETDTAKEVARAARSVDGEFPTDLNGSAGEVLLQGKPNEKHKELLNRHPKNYLPYLYYPAKERHTKIARKELNLTPEPFHASYTRLVEYMAYKIRVSPDRIHSFVAYIDEEIVALCDHGSFDDPEVKEQIKRERVSHKSRNLKNRPFGWGKLHVEEEKLKRLIEETAKNQGDQEKRRRLKELKQKMESIRNAREEADPGVDKESDSHQYVPLAEFLPNSSSDEEEGGRTTAEV